MRSIGGWACVAMLASCVAAPSRVELPGKPLADDVSLLPGTFVPGVQPDGNTVILRGPDGLVVVDTGRHAEHTARIVQAAQASGSAIAVIVNTHWHLDHVAGNVAVRDAFPQARVLASSAIDEARHGFLADYRAQLQQLMAQPDAKPDSIAAWREEIARIDAGDRLSPTQVVSGFQDRTLAGRRVQLGLERNAASGGDVWLFDPATRTLVAGDLVTLPVPLFDTACPSGWRAALESIGALRFSTLVPGHGAPIDRQEFLRYRQAFADLLQCAASAAPAATCKAGWLQAAGPLIPPGDTALANSLLDYYIPHVLRAPPERRDRYCRKDSMK